MISQSQIDELCRRIKSDENFDEVYDIVRKNCYSKAYMVGGRVYRTLAEILYGRDCFSKSVDWDFFCVGLVTDNFIPRGWNKKKSPYMKNNSLQLIKRAKRTPHHFGKNKRGCPSPYPGRDSSKKQDKIDIIAAKDIDKLISEKDKRYKTKLQTYFAAVPLDIQAIGLDIDNAILLGKAGVKAIEDRVIKINNRKTLNPNTDINQYLWEKSVAIGFTSAETVKKTDCDCFGGDMKELWNKGCQFPGVHK